MGEDFTHGPHDMIKGWIPDAGCWILLLDNGYLHAVHGHSQGREGRCRIIARRLRHGVAAYSSPTATPWDM